MMKMMMKGLGIIAASLMLALFFATPNNLAAQEGGDGGCGWTCQACGQGNLKKEGTDPNPAGEWNIDCPSSGGKMDTCRTTGCTGALLANGTLAGAGVAHLVSQATASELDALVAGYGDRLFLDAEQRLLLVVGMSCDEGALSDMVVLTSDKAKRLQALGVAPTTALLAADR